MSYFAKHVNLSKFYLTSDSINSFSQYLENDLTILLNGETLQVNSVFSSLLSRRILNYIQTYQRLEIDFFDFEYPNVLINIMMIQQEIKFTFDKYPPEIIIKAMLYLQINISKYLHLLTSVHQFELVLSSPNLFLENEPLFLELVMKKIIENQAYIVLIKFLYFGLCHQKTLINLINSLSFNQIQKNLFIHIQNSFYMNFILYEIYPHFKYTSFFQIRNENQYLKELFQIPINISSLNYLIIQDN